MKRSVYSIGKWVVSLIVVVFLFTCMVWYWAPKDSYVRTESRQIKHLMACNQTIQEKCMEMMKNKVSNDKVKRANDKPEKPYYIETFIAFNY